MSEIPQIFVCDVELEESIADISDKGTLQEQTNSNPLQDNLRAGQVFRDLQIRLQSLLHSEAATTPKYSTDS